MATKHKRGRDARARRILANGEASRRGVERRRDLAAKLGSHAAAVFAQGCERLADVLEPEPPVERDALGFMIDLVRRDDPEEAARMDEVADEYAEKAAGGYVLRPLLRQLTEGEPAGAPRPSILDRCEPGGLLEQIAEELEAAEAKAVEVVLGILSGRDGAVAAPVYPTGRLDQWWANVEDGATLDQWLQRQMASDLSGESPAAD